MKHNDIDKLTRECEEAELLYQEAMKARHTAVAASQEALKLATRARSRLMRAQAGQQGAPAVRAGTGEGEGG